MDYELQIINTETGKEYKSYANKIGVFENEPFAIRFKNNTWKKVQVRISVDGTDIVTGKEASTEPNGEMWLVQPYSTLELKAWPETASGGAEFLFGKAENSVAANTHGTMSGKGYICAAVYTGTEPILINNTYNCPPVKRHDIWDKSVRIWNDWEFNNSIDYSNPLGTFADTTKSFSRDILRSNTKCNQINGSLSIDEITDIAVGAGDYVDQKITKTAGLSNPVLDKIVSIKYMHWMELRDSLRKEYKPVDHPGFPADQKLLDLKGTPRVRRIKPQDRYIEHQRFV